MEVSIAKGIRLAREAEEIPLSARTRSRILLLLLFPPPSTPSYFWDWILTSTESSISGNDLGKGSCQAAVSEESIVSFDLIASHSPASFVPSPPRLPSVRQLCQKLYNKVRKPVRFLLTTGYVKLFLFLKTKWSLSISFPIETFRSKGEVNFLPIFSFCIHINEIDSVFASTPIKILKQILPSDVQIFFHLSKKKHAIFQYFIFYTYLTCLLKKKKKSESEKYLWIVDPTVK